MDIEKVNEFDFLNEGVEEFISRWNQNLVNVRSPSYLKEKIICTYLFRWVCFQRLGPRSTK